MIGRTISHSDIRMEDKLGEGKMGAVTVPREDN